MRRSGAVCLCLAVCLLTGCAGRPAGPDPSPAGLDPLQPTMPAWALAATPAPGVALDHPQGGSMPWRLAAISDDRRTITVVYAAGDGDCVKHLGHVLDVQGMTVTLAEYSTTATGRACADMLATGVETIALPIALDDSVQLVHAPASAWSIPD